VVCWEHHRTPQKEGGEGARLLEYLGSTDSGEREVGKKPPMAAMNFGKQVNKIKILLT
jgi:hypothetical protein